MVNKIYGHASSSVLDISVHICFLNYTDITFKWVYMTVLNVNRYTWLCIQVCIGCFCVHICLNYTDQGSNWNICLY